MFEPLETPHKRAVDLSGAVFTPVATLEHSENGAFCHVAVDDDCYVVYISGPDGDFASTPYLFPEVVAVLAKLPPLSTQSA
jgi:hypothetical protein